MPTFYFDTANDECLTHDDAVDLASVDAAQTEALRYLAAASIDHLQPEHPLRCSVKDEHGRVVLKVRLLIEIERP